MSYGRTFTGRPLFSLEYVGNPAGVGPQVEVRNFTFQDRQHLQQLVRGVEIGGDRGWTVDRPCAEQANLYLLYRRRSAENYKPYPDNLDEWKELMQAVEDNVSKVEIHNKCLGMMLRLGENPFNKW